MSSVPTQRRHDLAPAVLLAALTALAFALRFWRLGDWNLEATEIFTLRDSIGQPRLSNPRPLMYLLNHYVVQPFTPLNELGLRLLPALFGVLAVPAIYLVGRRLIGTRAALFSALLVAVSGILIYYSQYARYWSLVFLLCAIYPYAIYVGVLERDRRSLALGLVGGVLAVLAHPVAILPVGGLGAWMALTYLRGDQAAQLWAQRGVRRGLLGQRHSAPSSPCGSSRYCRAGSRCTTRARAVSSCSTSRAAPG